MAEGQQAAAGQNPMKAILNDAIEEGVDYQYKERVKYENRGNAPGEELDYSNVGVPQAGANEENFQRNYVKQDHFGGGGNGGPEIDPSQDAYFNYSAYRDLYKAHEGNKQQKSAWESSRGQRIERYKLPKSDPLRQMKVPGTNDLIKHGYRLKMLKKKK